MSHDDGLVGYRQVVNTNNMVIRTWWWSRSICVRGSSSDVRLGRLTGSLVGASLFKTLL